MSRNLFTILRLKTFTANKLKARNIFKRSKFSKNEVNFLCFYQISLKSIYVSVMEKYNQISSSIFSLVFQDFL